MINQGIKNYERLRYLVDTYGRDGVLETPDVMIERVCSDLSIYVTGRDCLLTKYGDMFSVDENGSIIRESQYVSDFIYDKVMYCCSIYFCDSLADVDHYARVLEL